jgi:hypothetical protein
MDRAIVWSYGGGVQSVAIAVLILQGRLPKPDCIVMSDTGRERTRVWRYAEQWVLPALASVGLSIEIASHSLATVDLVGRNGDLLIPVFTESGKLSTFCSTEWKQRVVRRYLRQRGYGSEKPVLMWFGMSLDEVDRMRVADVAWIKNYYPLCQDVSLRLRRHECVLTVTRFGWPIPPKSACWMCPNRDNETWREMKEEEPADFAEAVKMDLWIRSQGWGDVYLHPSRIPLSDVDFSQQEERDLFTECASSCWT